MIKRALTIVTFETVSWNDETIQAEAIYNY